MLSKDLYEELAKRLKRFNFSLDMLKTELLTIYGKEEAKAIIDYLDKNEECNQSDFFLARVDINN